MTYDDDFESYSDGAGAHQQGLDNQHVIIVHDPKPFGRWPRRRGLRFDVTCEGCGWTGAALYHQLAIDLAWEHASYTHGTVMQAGKP